LVDHLERTEYPGLTFKDRHEAQDWLYAEANCLLSCVRQSASASGLRRAVDLLWAAKDLAESGANSRQYEAVAVAVRDIAQASDDTRAEARARTALTDAHLAAGRFDQAEEESRHAKALAPDLGDAALNCWVPNHRGVIAVYNNLHSEGATYLQEAIDSFRSDGNLAGEASALCNLSRSHLAMGRTASAIELAQLGVDLYDRLGHALRGANGRYALGLALAQSGQIDEATSRLLEALAVFRDSRQRLWEGMTLFRLAEVDLTAQRLTQAAVNAESALTVLRGIGGEWRRGNVLTVLGRALQGIGQSGRAHACWQEALTIYERLDSPEAAAVRSLLTPTAAA
jgi:tetratricopeptide (TPR) repeat protein